MSVSLEKSGADSNERAGLLNSRYETSIQIQEKNGCETKDGLDFSGGDNFHHADYAADGVIIHSESPDSSTAEDPELDRKERDNDRTSPLISSGMRLIPPPGLILFQNFLGRAPFAYKVAIISCLIFNPIFMLLAGKFWTGWLITGEFIFTLIMALHCYPLQPGGLIVLEAVLMGMVSTHGVYHHLVDNLHVILLVIFMVAGIHFMREFLMFFFTKVLLHFPNKVQLSLVFLLSTALFSAWLDALTVTAVIMNACFGFYAIYHRIASEETKKNVEQPHVALSNPSTPHKIRVKMDSNGNTAANYGAIPTSPQNNSRTSTVQNSSTHTNTPSKTQKDELSHDSHSTDSHVTEFDDSLLDEEHSKTLDEFRAFLRSILMHAVVGTALGGALTIVGEPQNLLIGEKVGWSFLEYFVRCAPISVPTLFAGILTCVLLEYSGKWGRTFGYGVSMPQEVKTALEDYTLNEQNQGRYDVKAMIIVQILVGIMLVVLLGSHVAAVGLIGLTVIILLTSFNGVTDESRLGESFTEAMPFTALLVVFFAVAGIIEENELFADMVSYIIALHGKEQLGYLFVMDGVLSAVSDNVFVATLYINSFSRAYLSGLISKAQLNLIAVAINISTNIPSIATPNGQAAFLFLYTSKLAPLVGLSYFRMMWMALPYTLVLTSIAFGFTMGLGTFTQGMVNAGMLSSL